MMVSVAEAENIVLEQSVDYGTEQVPFELALGRVLAEDIVADRDLPPTDRVTMDGIAIRYSAFESGVRSYTIRAAIAAGDIPTEIEAPRECVEIMTGGALPGSVDTVVRYEDVGIADGVATVNTDAIKKGQNLHRKGKDKKEGEVVATANQFITPALIGIAASVGKSTLLVKKLPKVVIMSTGGELVSVDTQPNPYQVRRSNSYTVKAVLQKHSIVADTLHIPDDPEMTFREIKRRLDSYDVLILSGGVSMGKFDYVPGALEELGVTRLFHKVQQRPGKPFWFGRSAKAHDSTKAHDLTRVHDSRKGHDALVFAFPGNPVSTFLCLHRYFLPWLERNLNVKCQSRKMYAVLERDVTFNLPLQYFMQVKLHISEQGQLLATPVEGNGSGDFANLVDSDAFMELPIEQNEFKKGEVFRVWPFN